MVRNCGKPSGYPWQKSKREVFEETGRESVLAAAEMEAETGAFIPGHTSISPVGLLGLSHMPSQALTHKSPPESSAAMSSCPPPP